MSDLTKDQKSLLLYLETRAVDHGGIIQTQHMNNEDFEQACEWNEDGFIQFGRICFDHVIKRGCTHWVRLSDEAMDTVHLLRKERAERMWEARNYVTTKEANAR